MDKWEQLSFYNEPPLKIKNKVRLIELFSGIGAQAKALERLGVDFERYRAYDIDKYAVASYNAVHGTSFEIGDITKIHAEDLGIVDRDDFTYLLTYSFPCQDLSLAGRQKGMGRGTGTRSGLLWEVERLLHECGENLPHILVMENVPQIIAQQNKFDFDMWRESLRELGYTNKYQILNAKDYGVPQNRERCFMVSWLGEYDYEYPEPITLKRRLKDLLEKDVDEKYYLTQEQIDTFVWYQDEQRRRGNTFADFNPIDPETTHTHTHCGLDTEAEMTITLRCVGTVEGGGYEKRIEMVRRVYDEEGQAPALMTDRKSTLKLVMTNENS